MKINLILGDCIKVMESFKDQQFDFCFADPPYNAKYIGPKKRIYGNKEDLVTMQMPPKEYEKFCFGNDYQLKN